MITQQEVSRISPYYEQLLGMRNRWKWLFGFGVALVIVGALAIAAAFLTTLTTILVFGLMLLIGGAVEIASAILAQNTKSAFLHLIVGVIHLIAGVLMVQHPVQAAQGLTLMLAAAFLVGGVIRVGYSLTHSFSGRGWALASGFVATMLGLSIWQQWPESGLWTLGVFIGIDILLIGWSWLVLGISLRSLPTGQG